MSSLLTPKRRERAKQKARTTLTLSPSMKSNTSSSTHSSSRHNHQSGKYHAMKDDDDDDYDYDNEEVYTTARNTSSSNIPPRVVTPTKPSSSWIKQHQSWDEQHHVNESNTTNKQNNNNKKKSWYGSKYRAHVNTYNNKESHSNVSSSHTVGSYNSPSKKTTYVAVSSTSKQEMQSQSQQSHIRSASFDSPLLHRFAIGNNDEQKPFDEDMPMDEMMVDQKQQQQPRRRGNDTDSATYRSMTPTKEVTDIVSTMSVNSSDGATTSGIKKMILALNSNNGTSYAIRPKELTHEECILWDAIQTVMVNDRSENVAKRRNLERIVQEKTTIINKLTADETELQLQLAQSKCECADLEYKYNMAISNSGSNGKQKITKDGNDNDIDNGNDINDGTNVQQQFLSYEIKLKERDEKLKQQQKDHDAEVRAIQRVLADVTTEKVKLQETLDQKDKTDERSVSSKNKTDTSSDVESAELTQKDNDNSDDLITEQLHNLEKEKEENAERVSALEKELKVANTQLNAIVEEKKKVSNDVVSAKNEIQSLNNKVEQLESELSARIKEKEELKAKLVDETAAQKDRNIIEQPKPETEHPKPKSVSSTEDDDQDGENIEKNENEDHKNDKEARVVSAAEPSADEVEKLKLNLAQTNSSLENAKKIIASLENANGSLALDLRSKLKAKEEELSVAHKESEERKRRLDSLATELRDLQKRQGDIEDADRRTEAQLMKQKALVGHLETSLSDLQSAVVVHEASVSSDCGVLNSSSIDEISEILGDTLHALKVTLQAAEQFVEDMDDMSMANTDVELSSEIGRHIDSIIRNDREAAAKDLRFQLDQKRIAVKRLEEALKKQNEEMKKLRHQLDAGGRNKGETEDELRAEIQSLRQQCSTNMEVLAKKERELSVLRSSLKVDDNDAGYISDDASEDEDDDGSVDKSLPSPTKFSAYGPADAEALATILSQTSGGIDVPGRAREIESLKKELLKALGEKEKAANELHAERESLANAKMIISSLEKANKGMMEDLRSRLQDSNTAIASLLDKSMEHEKASEMLRQEVEKLKQEKLEEQKKHEDEVTRLKEKMSTKIDVVELRTDKNLELSSEEKKEELVKSESF